MQPTRNIINRRRKRVTDMHEIGLLYSIAETAEKCAEENKASSVESIWVEVGELAGVLPDIFTGYFRYVADQYPLLKQAELKIRTIPGEAVCMKCGKMYNVMRNEGRCPSCGAADKKIMSGQNMVIRRIIIE